MTLARLLGNQPGLTVLLVFTLQLLVAGCSLDESLTVTPEFRTVSVINSPFRTYSNQEVVDMAALYPDAFIITDVKSGRPIGHPDFSTDDCVNNPDSQGCRIATIRELAAAQAVTVDKLCMSFRSDVYRKLPDPYDVDTIDGVAFDTDWLMRVPGDEYETDLAKWRNGVVHPNNVIDPSWVDSLEDECCNDAILGNCTQDDQCLARYGAGDDVSQQFKVSYLVADLRNQDYVQWTAERFVAKLEDVGADCAFLGYKPGWFIFYDGPDSEDECYQPDGYAWAGPTKTFDPCARIGGPMSPTQYGPGEYEAAMNNALFRLSIHPYSMGYMPEDLQLVIAERPDSLDTRWWWMGTYNLMSAYLAGEYWTTIYPSGPPPPSVSVYLTPPPTGGLAPVLDVDLTADVRGSATGPIDYYFWCNCLNTTQDIATAQANCGTTPGEYYEVLDSTQDPITISGACSYPEVGTYYPKVLVLRESAAREDRIALNVD
jgi:hypothetical protein